MRNPAKIAKIIGPPGTGKTTELMRLIGAATQKYDSGRIGAVSFTNAAVNEIRQRIAKASGTSRQAARNARTIHSHCFRMLELNRDKVADEKIVQWNEDYPNYALPSDRVAPEDMDLEGRTLKPGEIPDYEKKQNQRVFNTIQVLRNKMIPEEKWEEKIGNKVANAFYNSWKDWMFMNDYIDYTGMLEKALKEEMMPDIDVLFVDEAQDLTPLSIELMKMWSEEVVSTVFVGDSDQCIFRFGGAVPEVFMDLEAGWNKLLEQSYRVPRSVHNVALSVIEQATRRDESPYKPVERDGNFLRAVTEPDFSLPGSHMIITRCNYHLKKWRKHLLGKREPWHNPYRPGDKSWNPTSTKVWRAAGTYLRLKGGQEISVEEFKNLIDCTKSKGNLIRGAKTKAKEFFLDDKARFDLFDLAATGFFKENFMSFNKPVIEVFKMTGQAGKIIEQGIDDEIILKGPRVIIGTIHSVKGGEADHVWVDRRTAPQCYYRPGTEGWDDEVRIGYVAVTRAKETLGFVSSGRNNGLQNPVFSRIFD